MGNPHMDRIAEVLANDPKADKKTLVVAGAEVGTMMVGAVSGKGDLLADMRRSLTQLEFSPETIDSAVNAARPFAQIVKQLGSALGEGTGRY